MRSRPAAWAIVTILALVLTACSGSDEPDPASAEGAADRLASALVSGDLSGVLFADDAPGDPTAVYTKTVEGMGEVPPSVRLASVEEQDDSAVATLSWSWPVGPDGEQWTYESRAELLRSADDQWQVTWHRNLVEPSLTNGTVLDSTPIAARRGDITGAGGLALITARPVVRVGLDKSQLDGDVRGAARALATLVDIDVAPYVALAKAAGAKAFVEAIVYRQDEVPAAVTQGYDVIPGGRLVSDDIPIGPTRGFAAPILGTVGQVTAELIEEHPDRYEVGDEAGLSGLQSRYDEELQGSPGVVVDAIASDGKERELFRVDARQGKALKTTLDLDLQVAAESLLAGVGAASAIVAIRPSDGAILAAANGPGTDGYNMATYGQLAPGSTFKAVSSLALLRAGVGPETIVSCPPTIVVDGKSFKNYDDYPSGGIGEIPFRTALANSCNTAFISERDRIGERDLADAAAALGVGIDHDLGFPAYFGSVEPAESETEKAADLIGQGKILASPMAMASVIASVQRGELVVPRLLEQVEVGVPDHRSPLTPDEASTLQAMLRGVVTGGSGAGLADVPGPPVLAKTGTAEFERDGAILTHAWMIAAQGDLAVAVFVEVGASGSQTAGPILEGFLRTAR